MVMSEKPWIDIVPGIRRRTVANDQTMYQMMAKLDAGSRMPAHQHPRDDYLAVDES